MYEYMMSFSTTGLAVYSITTTILATGEVEQNTVTNVIITILASAVAILWKKVDKHYKKVEIENSGFKADLLIQKQRNDICEADRIRIQQELSYLKINGCNHNCQLRKES